MSTVRSAGEHEGLHWRIVEGRVPAALRPFVRSVALYEERASGLVERIEVPAPQVAIIVEWERSLRVGGTHYKGGFVAGVGHPGARCVYRGAQGGLQVLLSLDGARALLNLPLDVYAGRILPIEEAPACKALIAALAHALDERAQLDAVFRWARSRLRHADPVSTFGIWLVDALGGERAVRSLVAETGFSHRRFLRETRAALGLGPAAFRRLLRFHRAMEPVQGSAPLAQVAVDAGYADQAHFTREVRRFSGVSPSELRAFLHAPLGAKQR